MQINMKPRSPQYYTMSENERKSYDKARNEMYNNYRKFRDKKGC